MSKKFDVSQFDSYIKTLKLQNGETLAYEDFNNEKSKVMILIHTNASSSYIWFPLIQQLIESDFRIIALDLRGFGRSSYNKRCEKIKDWADDVVDFIHQLKFPQSIFIGLSFGGAVVQQILVHYPNIVKKAILISSLSLSGYPIMSNGKRSQTMEQVKQNQFVQEIESYILKQDFKGMSNILNKYILNGSYEVDISKQLDKRLVDEMLLQKCYMDCNYSMTTYDISDKGNNEYKKIQTNILFIHGENDKMISHENAKYNYELLGKERAQLITFKGASHIPFFDQPEKISKSIIDFINQI
ncbi:hypothetical protein PPERSA_04293 [Pseudocohnilembus persalinus]|uniref:AB hydrolase-1 domain-containing protein n=1 Tax=Pseudocohnilembus persalinus TaxID=266149 RepID=A0A0V0QN57_PSEPJ|nr:hypothetical protein PPERSA_04293 [Pseudocohnilembus persalinus]|eukprot:KRX03785.1 hypothetical protein PPERSA_04293 [Pseudocohnilembus persalinus]